MTQPTVVYRHNQSPSRGLAAAGILPPVKLLLALPHLWIVGALTTVAQVVAYVGYWVVAITGVMPSGIFDLMKITQRWSMRTWAWIFGITDAYPPFEINPVYPADVTLDPPENPSRGWAVAGIVFAKFIVGLPHFVVLSFLAVGAFFAAWYGFFVTAFTGRLPEGVQDFLMGVAQWAVRVYAWLAGITDEYPPFRLDAQPVG